LPEVYIYGVIGETSQFRSFTRQKANRRRKHARRPDFVNQVLRESLYPYMSDWHELLSVLDSCSSLFLRDIGEPEENALRLVLHEGKTNPQSESLEIGGTRIDGLHRVYTGADSRLIELVWRKYVAYGVTNESFALEDGTSSPESGRLLRRYSKSAFLEYVAHATLATDKYPGPYMHVEVVAENHIVDVVSTELPSLHLLSPV
jgi:hypothetical protein